MSIKVSCNIFIAMTSHGNALVPTKPYTPEYRIEAGSVSIKLLLGIHVDGDSAVVYVFGRVQCEFSAEMKTALVVTFDRIETRLERNEPRTFSFPRKSRIFGIVYVRMGPTFMLVGPIAAEAIKRFAILGQL